MTFFTYATSLEYIKTRIKQQYNAKNYPNKTPNLRQQIFRLNYRTLSDAEANSGEADNKLAIVATKPTKLVYNNPCNLS